MGPPHPFIPLRPIGGGAIVAPHKRDVQLGLDDCCSDLTPILKGAVQCGRPALDGLEVFDTEHGSQTLFEVEGVIVLRRLVRRIASCGARISHTWNPASIDTHFAWHTTHISLTQNEYTLRFAM
jgi:hypothetical protein